MLIEKSNKTMKSMTTKTLMEPSRKPSSLSSATSMTTDDGAAQLPEPHPEEPLLNKIPPGVFPTYGPLSIPIQCVVVILSLWASAVTTWQRLTWLQPLAILRGLRKAPSVTEIVVFLSKVRTLL